MALLKGSLMADTPDTAESIQADRLPTTSYLIGQLNRAERTIAEARNYIGEPRTPFTKAIAEILDRGLRR